MLFHATICTQRLLEFFPVWRTCQNFYNTYLQTSYLSFLCLRPMSYKHEHASTRGETTFQTGSEATQASVACCAECAKSKQMAWGRPLVLFKIAVCSGHLEVPAAAPRRRHVWSRCRRTLNRRAAGARRNCENLLPFRGHLWVGEQCGNSILF